MTNTTLHIELSARMDRRIGGSVVEANRPQQGDDPEGRAVFNYSEGSLIMGLTLETEDREMAVITAQAALDEAVLAVDLPIHLERAIEDETIVFNLNPWRTLILNTEEALNNLLDDWGLDDEKYKDMADVAALDAYRRDNDGDDDGLVGAAAA